MNVEKRYPFLSEDNLELIRHISLPFAVNCSFTPPPDLVSITQSLLAVSIIPSRHYQFKNFEIGLDYASSSSGVPAPPLCNVPLLNIQGLQSSNLTIDTILSDYGNPAYTYNGILNNPQNNLQILDIYSQDGSVQLGGNYNVLSLINVACPSSFNNLLGQKSTGNQISMIANPLAPGFYAFITPTASHKEMYIRNTNYSAILFSFTPVHRGGPGSVNMSGVISFDLYQYSMKN